MKKAALFKIAKNDQIQCLACQRYCLISNGQLGFCKARQNIGGRLYSLIDGVLNGMQIDPIEKKPFYHFHPGEKVLSLGSFGCNYRCKQCLNFWCSWGEYANQKLENLKQGRDKGEYVNPKKIVVLAKKHQCPGIAFTYNEPSIWPEYVYICAKEAKKNHLFTVYVTNGSWSKEALDYLAPVIDACNIDIKGFYPQTYTKMAAFFGDILNVTEMVVKKYHIFTELTTLIIPTINDSAKELTAIANWIAKKLGPEIPWHLSRLDPKLCDDQEFQTLPATSTETLKKAYQIGKKAGLKHVYVWAPASSKESFYSEGNTYCPNCKSIVISRDFWKPKINGLIKNHKLQCVKCNYQLNIRL